MTLQKQTAVVLCAMLPLLMAFSFSNTSTISSPRPSFSLSVADTPGIRQNVAPAQIHFDTQQILSAKPVPTLPVNVASFVKRFVKQSNEELAAAAKRSKSVFRTIDPIFERQGIPRELRYLAVVESWLKNAARSRVGAAGLWQLMPQTARDLRLTVNGRTDDRKNAYKSTAAAARYLKALYNEYEDWLLVTAAYNAGPGVINKAIKKAGSRSFWHLQRFLPAETRGHVKRFIAIHVYFEGTAGLTTLTKTERAAFDKKYEDWVAAQEATRPPANADSASKPTAVLMASREKK